MSLPSLCIKRPVFTVMIVLLPVFFGWMAVKRMGVGLYPNVELPIVLVTTNRPGASADEMETGVTKLIEEEVNTVSDIDELRSETTEGLSVVTILFHLSKNADTAFQEVQTKVNGLRSRLPSGTEQPIVDKFDIGAAPVMTIAVSSTRAIRELTEIADKEISESLSSLSGVGSVTVVGGEHRAIQVSVDARMLEAYGLSIVDVESALRAQNVEIPGGRVAAERRELVLRTLGRVNDPAEIADIVVAERSGRQVRIKDLAATETVHDDVEEPRSLARLDGRRAVVLVVQKQSGTNTVEVIDAVKARLAALGESFAREGKDDIRLEVIRDQSIFIKASLHEVETHLLLGAVLVVLTIIAFLRDWRATLIAAVAIPASLLAAFPVMHWFHLTIDNITLIGLVLVIGIVIDDAVIVIENIFRWMEEKGKTPREAALEGTKEITLAVVATTLSLAVIFIPIAFMGGTVGLFLRAFGVTCAVCILVSLMISLTLTPMLSSRLLKKPKHIKTAAETMRAAGGIYGWFVERPYMALLRLSMRQRWLVVLLTIASVAAVFPVPKAKWPGLIGMVGFDFIPKDDQSEFLVVFSTPMDWSLGKVSQTAESIEKRLRAWPEVTTLLTQIGETSGRRAKGEGGVARASIYVRLEPLGHRSRPFTQFEIMARARELLKDYPDLRTGVQVVKPIEGGGYSSSDLEFLLLGPDLAKLQDYAAQMIEKLRAMPGLADVDTTLADRRPEMRIKIDRDRAADLGVSIDAAAAALRTLVGGKIVADYKDASIGELYDVWLRADGIDRRDENAIARLTVPSASGKLVRLDNIATPIEGLGPAQIDRAFRQRKISIIANLAGMPTGTAAKVFFDTFASLNAPPTYTLTTTGAAKNSAESNAAFGLAFGLSLILMYMILAAQFESFIHPVTILLAVPLTIPFALLSQIFFGTPMSLFSLLGLFLLFGIVKKNGILQIDYTNTLRTNLIEDPSIMPFPFGDQPGTPKNGYERWIRKLSPERRHRLWAVLEANRVRLRPILMTTIMLVAAMVPIAMGEGPGAANRADMARVIIGGQSLSLLLSLLVTPVAYSLFDDVSLFFRGRRKD